VITNLSYPKSPKPEVFKSVELGWFQDRLLMGKTPQTGSTIGKRVGVGPPPPFNSSHIPTKFQDWIYHPEPPKIEGSEIIRVAGDTAQLIAHHLQRA